MFSVQFHILTKLASSWHIGTGMGQGLVDRTTQRDPTGNVFIPGSTIKGRLRNACEQLARLYWSQDNKLRTCTPPLPQKMCRGTDACIVCRIFGSAYLGERVYVANGALVSTLRGFYPAAGQAQARTRVKLNNRLGIAQHGHLYTTEYAESGLVFRSEIAGTISLTPFEGDRTKAYELILLAGGLRLVKDLGGNKSAGFGACEMSFDGDISVDGQAVDPAELFGVIDYLQLYGLE